MPYPVKSDREIIMKRQYIDRNIADIAGTELWLTLFMIADRADPELAHILEFLRNSGTVLKKSEKFGYVLKGEFPDYDTEKLALGAYTDKLIKCLRELRRF
jgi:hypothetical protein